MGFRVSFDTNHAELSNLYISVIVRIESGLGREILI